MSSTSRRRSNSACSVSRPNDRNQRLRGDLARPGADRQPVSIWLRIVTALSEIVVDAIAQLLIGALVGGATLGAGESWVKFLAGTAEAADVLTETVKRARKVSRRTRTPGPDSPG